MNKKVNGSSLKMKTMTIGLTKKQICYLDGISKNCRFSGGRKMSRMAILRSLLLACQDIEIDVKSIKSEKELCEKVLAAFERNK
jgi:hypothetical protein